ncbi:MAG: HisA/HisF-related TIM barrel protein [Promethearchaeota archaeon]
MSNNEFQIFLVLDILNSSAVHAIKGDRARYKPLQSYLFNSSNPKEIISVLKLKHGFKDFYMADLNAITKKGNNLEMILKLIEEFKINVSLDPGISKIKDLYPFIDAPFHDLILGLETIENIRVIEKAIEIFGSNKIILSLDLYQGKLMSNIQEFKSLSLEKLVKRVEKMNVNKLILLDLYRVGQKLGGIPPIYLKIRHIFDKLVYVGGGIKDLDDVCLYKKNGFSGLLIGTALYDGTIEIQELIKMMD